MIPSFALLFILTVKTLTQIMYGC